MINLLERLFRRTMARYWWQARNTGVRYGIARVQAIIHSEIKSLRKHDQASKSDTATHAIGLRINELDYLLYQIEKVVEHENR